MVICSVSVSIYICGRVVSSTRISLNFDRLAEGCDKVRGPVEQTLGKKQQQIFLNIQVREKYLGNICSEKGWTDNFLFSSVFLSTP